MDIVKKFFIIGNFIIFSAFANANSNVNKLPLTSLSVKGGETSHFSGSVVMDYSNPNELPLTKTFTNLKNNQSEFISAANALQFDGSIRVLTGLTNTMCASINIMRDTSIPQGLVTITNYHRVGCHGIIPIRIINKTQGHYTAFGLILGQSKVVHFYGDATINDAMEFNIQTTWS